MTAAGQTGESSPLDKALDLGLFAPLGFALEFRRVVPELAEAGRRQLGFSRSLGQAALRTMARSAAAKKAAADAKPEPPATPGTVKKPVAKEPAAKKPATTKKPAAKKPAAKKPVAKKASTGRVAGYDTLTAREIIARCSTASPAQRAWMLDRESSGKARKTVLKALERPE